MIPAQTFVPEPEPWRAFVHSGWRGFGTVVGRVKQSGVDLAIFVQLENGREIRVNPAAVSDAQNIILL